MILFCFVQVTHKLFYYVLYVLMTVYKGIYTYIPYHWAVYTKYTVHIGIFVFLFMPPTLKKLEGHIAFGLSVCVCVCVCVCVLTFEW